MQGCNCTLIRPLKLLLRVLTCCLAKLVGPSDNDNDEAGQFHSVTPGHIVCVLYPPQVLSSIISEQHLA